MSDLNLIGELTEVRNYSPKNIKKRVYLTKRKILFTRRTTAHDWIAMLGILVGLWYLPYWLIEIFNRTVEGVSTPLIVVASVFFALQEIWNRRKQLANLSVRTKDRQLGHFLILTGAGLFPFCRFAFWSQALLWFLILIGIALSSWGASFFKKYPRLVVLLLLSVHPGVDILLGHLWRALTPHNSLDRFMAWSGSLALKAIGQQVTSTDVYIFLPTGGVEVGWGCNGFEMAVAMAGTGFLLGLVLKQNWLRTLWLVILGVALALTFNVPRIVLLTLAAANWGEESFNFWHGFWGGQIFATILFTAYYHLIMNILPRSSTGVRD